MRFRTSLLLPDEILNCQYLRCSTTLSATICQDVVTLVCAFHASVTIAEYDLPRSQHPEHKERTIQKRDSTCSAIHMSVGLFIESSKQPSPTSRHRKAARGVDVLLY
jgi:hypothetical protein